MKQPGIWVVEISRDGGKTWVAHHFGTTRQETRVMAREWTAWDKRGYRYRAARYERVSK